AGAPKADKLRQARRPTTSACGQKRSLMAGSSRGIGTSSVAYTRTGGNRVRRLASRVQMRFETPDANFDVGQHIPSRRIRQATFCQIFVKARFAGPNPKSQG